MAYTTRGFPGSSSQLQLMANGSATLHVAIEAGMPQDFTGMASAAALAALRADMATADLGSLSSEYACPDAQCNAPVPFRSITVEIGGAMKQISADGHVPDAQLPPGLVKVFQDLDAIADQLSSSPGS